MGFTSTIKYILLLTLIIIVIIISYTTFLSPMIGVYKARKMGESELAQADSNRKIKIREAQAEEEAATSLAHAEIIRAKGVAEANKIIGNSLKGNESYLRYLWVQGLQTNQMSTVYIPTEAGMPILEAGRFKEERCNQKHKDYSCFEEKESQECKK